MVKQLDFQIAGNCHCCRKGQRLIYFDRYVGMHRSFAIRDGVVAFATRGARGQRWQGAVVARLEDEEVLGCSGGLDDVVGLPWDGSDLLVAEAPGIVERFALLM